VSATSPGIREGAVVDETAVRVDGWSLPPVDAEFDYQLGGAYRPAGSVLVLSRDRGDRPASGRYNICYVNGFQTQPDERSLWTGANADLVLRDDGGEPLADPDWPGEMILDIGTDATRQRLTAIVGAWIDGCADDGFDAVEIDNLDTFTRFADRLSKADAVAYAAMLADRSHAAGLAFAQKNTAELLARRDAVGFDFAVVEECNQFGECGRFARAYADRIFVVEYRAAAFESGCTAFPELSIVLRDRDVRAPDQSGYVRRAC
jgi:hypothetical protein